MGAYPVRPSGVHDVAPGDGVVPRRHPSFGRWLAAKIADIVNHLRFRRSSKRADSAADEPRPTPTDRPEQPPPLAASTDGEREGEPLQPPVPGPDFSAADTPLRVVRPAGDVVPAADASDEAPAASLPPTPAPGGVDSDDDMRGVLLGTLVFRAGLVTFEQGEDALREATTTGRRLGQVLLERGWIDERQLARFLAGQKGLAFVDLELAAVDREAAARLTEDSARVFRALPLSRGGQGVVVAIADPTNEAVIAQIRAALGADVALGVAAGEELDAAISAAFSERADAGAVEPAAAPEPALSAPDAPSDASASPPEPHDAPADDRRGEPVETSFTREESQMEPPASPETPSQWPRPDESFGSVGRDEPQPPAAATPAFAATDPAQQYAVRQPEPAPGGFGTTGMGGGAAHTVAVRLVLRLGQADALELGSFDDPARATAFAMTLRPFLRPGTIVSLDIGDA